MKRLAFAAALFFVACGRGAAPDGSVEYRAADGSFQARLPGRWRADESRGESRRAALYGPPDGPRPYSQLMGVYFHAAADPDRAARLYLVGGPVDLAAGPPAPPRELAVGSRRGLEAVVSRHSPALDGAPADVRIRTVVVVVPGGFFSLEHTWPAGSAPAPAFDELIRTFEPAQPDHRAP